MSKCLYCYQELEKGMKDFHPACSKKIFGTPVPPELPYTESQMAELAKKVIKSQIAVTGVQPKLSLELEQDKKPMEAKRFTIVGLWGGYILKPPTKHYSHLPEVEDLTMHLATISKIKTVPHSLIRLKNGSLAYITKRIDRNKGKKLHMEDMCQLTERLTEHKYHGSYEQVAKAILKYSANPGLDAVNFYEQVVFSFITGNADMHLKNFSLITAQGGYVLAPAYDLVATALVNKGDNEELALNLNGKKRRIHREDFLQAFSRSGITGKAADSILDKFSTAHPKLNKFIDSSFLPLAMKKEYKQLISARLKQIKPI